MTERTVISSLLVAVLAQASGAAPPDAGNWPQYKGDAARSSVTTQSLGTPLKTSWVYQPPQRPRPAWEEPGKEAHRLHFDFAPQPVVADGRVFFGSSADDTVRALNRNTGGVLWRFTTGGPVRFAPAVAGDRVYVGSDDGYVYCLGAEKGDVKWRFRAAPADDLLIGNGRMISRWPLRCGVVVVDDVVYTVAGMWPTEGIHVYALDGKTGKVLWRNDSTGIQYVELPHPGATGFSGVAPQGYLAVSGDVLLVPTGRSCPAAFDRKTGKFLYCWPHRNWNDAKRGGCWLTTGAGLYFNGTREPRGTSESYVGEAPPLPNDGMVAYDVQTNKPVFELKGKNRVLVAGDVLYAVGNGEVAAYDLKVLRAKKGEAKAVKWKSPHLRVYSLALVGKTLFIGGKGTVTAYDATTGARKWYHTRDIPGPVRGLAVSAGRLIAATDHGILTCLGPAGGGVNQDTPDWRMPISVKGAKLADEVLRRAKKREGYALVVGDVDGSVGVALAMRSGLHAIQVVQGEAQAVAARQHLMHTDLYGSRVAVIGLEDLTRLPFASYFADLVLVAGKADGLSPRELYRVLRPCGGVMWFADQGDADRLVGQTGAPAKEITKDDEGRQMIARGPLAGASEWRHQWADGGRSGIGQESRLTMPLELLWFGGPGPDRMMDRHYGSSPPLSVNGRVFVTGEHHLIAFDAYNGRELWSTPIPGAGRRGAMWEGANFVADDTAVYVAVGAACHRICQATGEKLATYAMPKSVSNVPGKWYYIDVADDLLLGHCRQTSVLFALNKNDGSARWHWRPAHRVPSAGIAYGDGRVYCLDLEAPDEQARRRGAVKKPARRLVALNLSDGVELWRQEGVPQTPRDWVQYASGVVSIYANAAYDAASGKPLWQKAVASERPPLVMGEWIIAQPHAVHLRTGEMRKISDSITGAERPWEYIQSYGCGGVAGCKTMLFFRSAVAGFYDFETDGTTTFGGVRVGCSINMIAANGLAILPETSSGCPCSYNFQTSLALAPAADRKQGAWFIFAGKDVVEPVSRTSLNLGAPGDRLDDGVCWLGVPRPILRGATPVRMSVSSKAAAYYRHPRTDELSGMDKAWLYGSGVRDPGRITLDVISGSPVISMACKTPMVIDGKLDPDLRDAGAKGRFDLGFSHGMKRKATGYLRHDDANLYVAIQCRRGSGGRGELPWVKTCRGEDARVWEDDSWEVYLSDRRQRVCLHLGVSASGARFDGLWDCRAYEAVRGLNRDWNGAWKSAVTTDDETMTVELAVPFRVLEQAGLDRTTLCVNVLGTGPGSLGSPDFLSVRSDGFCARWRGFIVPAASGKYTLTVRADDRALLRIGDKTVIRHEGKGKPTETSAAVSMKAGERQPVELVYEEGKDTAAVQLLWSGPSTPKAVVPAAALCTTDGKPGGLSAAYSNRWFEDPVLERVDATVDFEWKQEDLQRVPKAELRSHWPQRPQRCERFLPVSFGPPKVRRTYTVRLHFAELEDVKPGERVFDVKVQDKPALQGVDVVRDAKGRRRPLVKEIKGVSCDDEARIAIDLVPRGQQTGAAAPPILSGVEIAAE